MTPMDLLLSTTVVGRVFSPAGQVLMFAHSNMPFVQNYKITTRSTEHAHRFSRTESVIHSTIGCDRREHVLAGRNPSVR